MVEDKVENEEDGRILINTEDVLTLGRILKDIFEKHKEVACPKLRLTKVAKIILAYFFPLSYFLRRIFGSIIQGRKNVKHDSGKGK